MSEEQGFIGIRSGLTGETVIMCISWHKAHEVRYLRIWWDRTASWSQLLGAATSGSPGVIYPTVWRPDDNNIVQLPTAITWTDAAMDILQYLSDECDPRLRLGSEEPAAWV